MATKLTLLRPNKASCGFSLFSTNDSTSCELKTGS